MCCQPALCIQGPSLGTKNSKKSLSNLKSSGGKPADTYLKFT